MKKPRTTQVWGITTCQTVKKTLKFLDAEGFEYEFKDFRVTPPTKSLLRDAMKSVGAPGKMFNTSGVSYRTGGYKARIADMTEEQIIAEMAADPMLIKRPIVRTAKGIVVGYDTVKLLSIL